MSKIDLILASASPRRQELLGLLGYPFQVYVADIDETPQDGESPEQLVERLAYSKALKVADQFPDNFVIGADTVVAIGQKILGKPSSINEAQAMLSELSGKTHQVICGYAILNKKQQLQIVRTQTTTVEFYSLNAQDIIDYVKTGEPMDKAGAYALQGIAAKFIKGICGSHTNVIGLDIASLKIELEKILLSSFQK